MTRSVSRIPLVRVEGSFSSYNSAGSILRFLENYRTTFIFVSFPVRSVDRLTHFFVHLLETDS